MALGAMAIAAVASTTGGHAATSAKKPIVKATQAKKSAKKAGAKKPIVKTSIVKTSIVKRAKPGRKTKKK